MWDIYDFLPFSTASHEIHKTNGKILTFIEIYCVPSIHYEANLYPHVVEYIFISANSSMNYNFFLSIREYFYPIKSGEIWDDGALKCLLNCDIQQRKCRHDARENKRTVCPVQHNFRPRCFLSEQNIWITHKLPRINIRFIVQWTPHRLRCWLSFFGSSWYAAARVIKSESIIRVSCSWVSTSVDRQHTQVHLGIISHQLTFIFVQFTSHLLRPLCGHLLPSNALSCAIFLSRKLYQLCMEEKCTDTSCMVMIHQHKKTLLLTLTKWLRSESTSYGVHWPFN